MRFASRRLDSSTTRLLLALVALLLASCSTTPQTSGSSLTPPGFVSPVVLEGLCGRLRMDAIASTAPLAIVSETRPLATQQTISALALTVRGRIRGNRVAASVAEANRALPVEVQNGQCTWRAVAPAQIERHRDEMLVELSAPAVHPFSPKEAGLFARVAVGGEGASWYWIPLLPHGDQWAIGRVTVLGQ